VRPGARLDRMGVMLVIMLVAGVMVGVHVLARMHWIGQVAAIAVYAGLLVWRWRALGNVSASRRTHLAHASSAE